MNLGALAQGGGGAGLVAVVVTFVSWWRNRNRDKADTHSVNIDAAVTMQAQSADFVRTMMEPLEKRLIAADADVDHLREKLRHANARLEHFMREMERAISRAELAESLLRQHGIDISYPDRQLKDGTN